MTIRLGLTGSIGMGKSTTAAMFVARGCALWDADAAVHRLYAKDGAAVDPISALYPSTVVAGTVDRALLKRLIHDDTTVLQKIEAIVHPLVLEDRNRFLHETDADIAVFDIPLLFEKGSEHEFNATACVHAPTDVQKSRVLARPGMDEKTFQMIVEKQMPSDQKVALATYAIPTKTFEGAQDAVDSIIVDLRKRFSNA